MGSPKGGENRDTEASSKREGGEVYIFSKSKDMQEARGGGW